MTLVIDASAVADLLLDRPQADRVAAQLLDHDYDLHAPHLLDVEVLSVLRRAVSTGIATAERATGAVSDLLELPVRRYPHRGLAQRIWELRENLSAHDAAYLALAEALADSGAALLTADARLARAARTHSDVEVLLVA